MSRKGQGLIKAALSGFHYTGLDSALAPFTRGVGVIFTLHHVRPATDRPFHPNGILEITPQFLDRVITLVQERGFDIISLDDVYARLTEGDLDRPFACFTFDDGYRDNLQHAYPIFRERRLPMAVYVANDLSDWKGDLWWLTLEHAIAATDTVEVKIDGVFRRFRCQSVADKERAFHAIYWWLRRIPEAEARQTVAELCRIHEVDVANLCRELVMNWDELRSFASDPLVTIGAHTRSHLALAKLTTSEARLEMEASMRRIEHELGRSCQHFSYPYGDESSAGEREFQLAHELGLRTAVTTRKGLVSSSHAHALTALPRVSLNGNFQNTRYVKVLLTGAPFAVLSAARRIRPRSIAA